MLNFTPTHCQRDYVYHQVTVQFDGDFNYAYSREYLNLNYPNLDVQLLEVIQQTEYKGFQNTGSATYRILNKQRPTNY